MTATVKAGERGVDFSFARPPAARLRELGYTFVVGYISVPPASPGKNITKVQCEEYLAAGLKVLLVWEMDAARPNLGATYGAIDGKNAALQAAARGYPTDVPILSAADLNTFFGNIDRHEAYMRAFAANCAPYPHEIGEYADTDLLARTAGLWRVGWVPLGAWAWSGTSYANALAKSKAVGAHVLQAKGFYIDNVWAVDPNEAIADFPAWGSDPGPPDTEEPDMPKFFDNKEQRAMPYGSADPQTAVFIADLTKRNIGGEEYAAYGSPARVSLSNMALDAIPDVGAGVVDMTARAAVAALQGTVASIDTELGAVKDGLLKTGGG